MVWRKNWVILCRCTSSPWGVQSLCSAKHIIIKTEKRAYKKEGCSDVRKSIMPRNTLMLFILKMKILQIWNRNNCDKLIKIKMSVVLGKCWALCVYYHLCSLEEYVSFPGLPVPTLQPREWPRFELEFIFLFWFYFT